MINKNKLIIFPILAVSALFLLSTFSKNSSDLSHTQNLEEEAYITKSFKREIIKKRKSKSSLKMNSRFAKSLQKNNLSLKLAEAREEAQYLNDQQDAEDFQEEEQFEVKEQKDDTDSKDKVASNDDKDSTDEEKEKEDQDKETDEEKENVAKSEEALDDDFESIEQASTVEAVQNDSSLITENSIHNTPPAALEEDSTEDEAVTAPTASRAAANTPTNSSLSLFSSQYFKKLLQENKLVEFEQALQLELSQEQMNGAYSEALSFLFQKTDEDLEFDNFVKTQFLQHRFAVSIAESFNTPEVSNFEIEYSAELLNQLVFAWNFENQEDARFNSIYQVAVINTIPAGLLTNDSISNLRANITSASLEISDSSVEVSVN